MTSRLCKLFAGYQFASRYYSRVDLDAAILRAASLATEALADQDVEIVYEPPTLEPGEGVLGQILDRIRASDICLFELSNGNRNVLFELGAAVGYGIPSILLRHSDARVPVPSDLSGVMYQRYSRVEELAILLGPTLVRLTKKSITASPRAQERVGDLVWLSSSKHERVLVVGGELSGVKSPSDVPGISYAQSPDVQALAEVAASLLVLSPNRDVEILSASYVDGPGFTEHLAAVGGPRSNSVTREILRRLSLPWSYELGDPNLPQQVRKRQKALVRGTDRLEPELDGEEVRRDVAMIALGPNPFNLSRRFLILSGAFTFGVLGAARAIAALNRSESNWMLLRDLARMRSGAIAQLVMYVEVINSQVVTPDLSTAMVEIIE